MFVDGARYPLSSAIAVSRPVRHTLCLHYKLPTQVSKPLYFLPLRYAVTGTGFWTQWRVVSGHLRPYVENGRFSADGVISYALYVPSSALTDTLPLRWRGEALRAMNVFRKASRVCYEDTRAVKVLLTRRKQWLPVNDEVLPTG
jgi:hypothetical protein